MTKIVYEGAQAALREEPMPAGPKQCAWCGAEAVTERVIVPARKKEGVVVEPEKVAPVCAQHNEMVNRNEEVASLKRKRRIQVRRIGHPKYDDDAVRKAIAELDKRLRELGERITPVAA